MKVMSGTIRHGGGLLNALFAHERHVYCNIERHETLVRADVGCSLLTTDMLLTCLQCEDEGTLSVGVDSLAYDAARNLSHELLCAAHITDIRTAEGHREPEALSVADSDIGTPLAWCAEEGKVGSDAVDDE